VSRRAAREKVLQALYQADVSESGIFKALENIISRAKLSPQAKEFAKKVAEGTWEKREAIDPYIAKYARRWKINRLASVDRNILRLAVYEMLYEPDIPFEVSIDEAVELAKKYSTPKAAAFINGILDSVKRELEEGPQGEQ